MASVGRRWRAARRPQWRSGHRYRWRRGCCRPDTRPVAAPGRRSGAPPGCCQQTIGPAPADSAEYAAPAALRQKARCWRPQPATPARQAVGSPSPTAGVSPPDVIRASAQRLRADGDRGAAPGRGDRADYPPASIHPARRSPATGARVCRSGCCRVARRSAPAPAR